MSPGIRAPGGALSTGRKSTLLRVDNVRRRSTTHSGTIKRPYLPADLEAALPAVSAVGRGLLDALGN